MKPVNALVPLCRLAIYVEEIHSESAKRIQLSTDEEIKNETFPSSSIVFSELKVILSDLLGKFTH